MSTSPGTHLKQTETVSSGTRNSSLGGKYVTFYLGSEEYGLEILKVREIIGMSSITQVPQTPQFVLGVINLRGSIIPVVDLRLRFRMDAIENTREKCIIVVRAHGIDTGVVVDRMSEVLDIEDDEIEDPPVMGATVKTDCILGIDKSQSRVKLLLDIEKVLSEIQMLENSTEQPDL